MSTSPIPDPWFYWQTGKDLFNPSPRQTHQFVLTEMIDAYISVDDAEYIHHELDEFVNHKTHEGYNEAELKAYVAVIIEALNAAQEKQKSLNRQYKKIQDKVSANKQLVETLEDQIKQLMLNADQNKVELPSGLTCKISLSPGALKAAREPNADDLKMFGDNMVKQSYSWNLINLKAGIAEGVISHDWMDKNGFTLVRNASLKIIKP